jgi:hypothetical protein
MTKVLLVLLFVAVIGGSALGQAGSVKGTLTLNKEAVTLKHAYAHLNDNAEKLAGRKRELRILLVDGEVPADSLYGASFPAVWDLAMAGTVKGLLIEMDPADPQSINIILLEKPTEAGRSLTSLSMSRSGQKLFKEWKLTPQRVAGALDRPEDENPGSEMPSATFSVKFDAPITREPPITADLKGAAAVKSPQVTALLARLDAIGRGDLDAVRATCSKRANRRLDTMPPEAFAELKKMGKQIAAEQRKSLKKVQRVIVRGNRALVIISKNEYATVVKEDGKWKSDD